MVCAHEAGARAGGVFYGVGMSDQRGPRALVIRTAGTNCDRELCHAFELAGARVELVHLDRLLADPDPIRRAELVGFPGGFSYGDDIASGRLFAVKLREGLYPELREAAERGAPMIGVCNGFQVMTQLGLLPGPGAGQPWPELAPPRQSVSLTGNRGARFIDDWIPVTLERPERCVWTEGLDAGMSPEVLRLPIAHGEGRFFAAPETLRMLEASGSVVMRYAENVNGSVGSIAGICDSTGRVFGLMPHPDRYTRWSLHPFWTRLDERTRRGEAPGLTMFRTAVDAARAARV